MFVDIAACIAVCHAREPAVVGPLLVWLEHEHRARIESMPIAIARGSRRARGPCQLMFAAAAVVSGCYDEPKLKKKQFPPQFTVETHTLTHVSARPARRPTK